MSPIQSTLYFDFLVERLDAGIIESEYGFLTYTTNEKECFIRDMFVVKAMRRDGIGRAMVQALEDRVKKSGCKILTANVFKYDKGHANTLTAAFAAGFEIISANNDTIFIGKKIKEANNG